jgi:hypothetical protein
MIMFWRIAASGLLLATQVVAGEGTAFIAGLAPAARPAGAPVVVAFEQTPAWKAQALRGIGEPRTGLGFLADQGAWYTPFNRPNSPAPYDIRGLHADGGRKD